jgi:glucosylceramidase
MTTADGAQRLAPQPDISIAQGSPEGTVIQLYTDETYQAFRGAGAAITESSAALLTAMPSSSRAEVMAKLFGSGPGAIGINYLRVPAGASDFALSSYSYDDIPFGSTDPLLTAFSISRDTDDVLPRLLQARSINPAVKVMGTPWSAPAWMKSTGSLNGGSLLPEWRQAYADYLVAYQRAYADQGVDLDALTVVNEPLHGTSAYPSMRMTASEQAGFIRDFLDPAMKAAQLDTKLLVYDHNWDNTEYPRQVLADSAVESATVGTAFHCYSGDVAAQSEMHAAFPSSSVWMTECSGGGWETSLAKNLAWNMRNLVVGNFRNWGETLLLWNLALDPDSGPTNGGCSNCRGVITVDPVSGSAAYNVEFYVLGHLTKFVQPGAVRVASTVYGPGGPENVAFRNPDGSIVLIVFSQAATTFSVAWGSERVRYSLPAGAAATIVLPPSGTTTPVPVRVSGPLQGFERDGGAFAVFQAELGSSSQARTGTGSLSATGVNGNWHTVGVYPVLGPADLADAQRICLWVNDQTGTTGNTVALKLVDDGGRRHEIWSDNASAGSNPSTAAQQWVKFCWPVSAFAVDRQRVDHLEITWFWPGTILIDDITLE